MTIKINSNTNSIEVNDVAVAIPTGGGSIVTTNDTGTVSTTMLADANVTTDKIANTAITTDKIADANITPSKLNGAQTGTAPAFVVRAWLYYNGVTNTIVGSGNVSSITDLGTGLYRVNFTTAMPSTAFSYAVCTRHQGGVTRGFVVERNAGRSASYFEMEQYDLPDNNNGNYSIKDCDRVGVIIVHQ